MGSGGGGDEGGGEGGGGGQGGGGGGGGGGIGGEGMGSDVVLTLGVVNDGNRRLRRRLGCKQEMKKNGGNDKSMTKDDVCLC